MKCPRCGAPTNTPKSVPIADGQQVKRIRRCMMRKCGWSGATLEVLDEDLLRLVARAAREAIGDHRRPQVRTS